MTDSGRLSVRPSSGGTPTLTRSGARWLYLVAGMLASVTIILASYLLLRSKPVQPDEGPLVTEENTNTPSEKPPDVTSRAKLTKLDVNIKGGPGLLFIDGKRIGKLSQKSMRIEPGKHVVEVRAKGKKLKTVIQLKDGDSLEVIADVKKGKFAGD